MILLKHFLVRRSQLLLYLALLHTIPFCRCDASFWIRTSWQNECTTSNVADAVRFFIINTMMSSIHSSRVFGQKQKHWTLSKSFIMIWATKRFANQKLLVPILNGAMEGSLLYTKLIELPTGLDTALFPYQLTPVCKCDLIRQTFWTCMEKMLKPSMSCRISLPSNTFCHLFGRCSQIKEV